MPQYIINKKKFESKLHCFNARFYILCVYAIMER